MAGSLVGMRATIVCTHSVEPRRGLSLFAVPRRMGTSLAMIDVRHLAPDAEEQERRLLDAFDVANAEEGDTPSVPGLPR
jgi:hypothetical protein